MAQQNNNNNNNSWSRGRLLGRGSTATVSLASTNSSVFAVKSADVSNSYFLQREQQIHSSIPSSPFVISYLGFDVLQSSYNLFLEFAPGGSLFDEVKTSKLSESAIRSRTRDILMGLSHLHSLGLVHGDIKSQNILIAGDGTAKIADLGCARFANGGESLSNFKFMGTPMFVSPEVAKGEEQGMAADVWAVGCTVIEMATGRAPWPEASDPVSLMHRIACSEDRPEVPDWLSEEGKDFLDRCLRREAEERWSAEQLLMHPFVANLNEECKWTSPKSTLDRSFWDSLSESEEDEAKVEFEVSRVNPIGELLFSGAAAAAATSPNWTWGDSWLTVREDDNTDSNEDQEVPVVAGGDDESLVASGIDEIDWDVALSSIDTSSSYEEFLISTNDQDDKADDCRVFGYEFLISNDPDNCLVVSRDNNYNYPDNGRIVISDNPENCSNFCVTMLWISNWIFGLVPVVILVFSYFSSSLLSCLMSFFLLLWFFHISPLSLLKFLTIICSSD